MQTPSHTLLGIQHDKNNSGQVSLSAIGKAFARADLNEVHEILLHDGYNEDDEANAEVKELFASKPYSFYVCCRNTVLYSFQQVPIQLLKPCDDK
jgi:hypothetical protein